MPAETKTRERKSCPSCGLVEIYKQRKDHGFYKCKGCGSVFQKPAMKEIRVYTGIPNCLKKIIARNKQKQEHEQKIPQ